jgi:hypothetical protein
MNSYKGQRENFVDSFGPKGVAKQVTEIVDIFKLFLNRELREEIVEETKRYTEQFL